MVDLAKYLQEGETPLGVYTDEGNVIHWSNIVVTDRRVLIYECTPPSPGELRTIDLKDIIDVHCRKKAMSAIIEIRTEKKVFKVYDLTRDAGGDAKEHIEQAAEAARSQVPDTITLPDGRVVQVVLQEPGIPLAMAPGQAITYQYPQQVPQEQPAQEQQPQQQWPQQTQPQQADQYPQEQQPQQQWPQQSQPQQADQYPQEQQPQQQVPQQSQPQQADQYPQQQQPQQQWPQQTQPQQADQYPQEQQPQQMPPQQQADQYPDQQHPVQPQVQQPPPEPQFVGQRMREDGTMEDMSPEEVQALAEEAEKAFKELEDLDV